MGELQGALQRFGNAKITEFDNTSLRHENVLRLEVTVKDLGKGVVASGLRQEL